MAKPTQGIVAVETALDASLSTPRWRETRRAVTRVASTISVMGVHEWLLQRELTDEVLSSRRGSGVVTVSGTSTPSLHGSVPQVCRFFGG